ncbi:DUF4148 domain-containing protein [Paraburkholderia sp.]|uniref:DUF4148 domain-containing protein n=1 Tax=Paraburkholderia sp. TaxID=1926495 RepID=UPI002390F1B2|nr:DUF4148 domain-containing protein [Paraburkholderia sp.]MDE1184223.1 hypothetical protein [Paraburkholderia sp.]
MTQSHTPLKVCARAGAAALLAIATSHLASAQTLPSTLTTHQAQQVELQQLQATGYRQGGDDPTYPRNIQKAERAIRADDRTGAHSYEGAVQVQ